MNIAAILNRPFPLIEKGSNRIIASLLVSASVYLFLFIFQPFGLEGVEMNKPLFLFGFFSITLVVMLVHFFLVPFLFPNYFAPLNWTLQKNLIYTLWQLSVISVGNWLYSNYAIEGIQSPYDLPSFIFFTMAVGFFPTVLLLLVIENYYTSRHTKVAEEFSTSLSQMQTDTDVEITLASESKNERLTVTMQKLICIKSEGNYSRIFFSTSDRVDSKLMRISLSKLEGQLQYRNIQRCHRSHIVNLQRIKRVTGNARNYNFHIDGLDFPIPVSRSFPRAVISKISQETTI